MVNESFLAAARQPPLRLADKRCFGSGLPDNLRSRSLGKNSHERLGRTVDHFKV